MPPLELSEILGASFACACGATHRVLTLQVRIAPGAAPALPEAAARHAPGGPIALVMDPHTREAAGDAAREALEAAGRRTRAIEVPPARADARTLEAVEAAIPPGAAGIVSAGSGSVTDLAKRAASRAGIPCIALATAASMNGYTSAIAAITVGGLKRTLPCRPAVAVLADPGTLAAAPPAMARAGYGDLRARTAAGADWLLAARLFAEPHCPYPEAIVDRVEPAVRAQAGGILRAEPEAVSALLEGLLLSGIGMAVAGSSAPASGGEHLLSHYWDMDVPGVRGERSPAGVRALHGAQTGAAACVSAALHGRLCAIDARELARRIRRTTSRIDEDALRRHFGGLAEPVLEEAARKALDAAARERLAVRVESAWDALREGIRSRLGPPASIRADLGRAGAPTTARELRIPAWEVREALLWARWIRGRWTVLDLAAEAGLLEAWADGVLEESGILAGPEDRSGDTDRAG